MSLPFPHSSNRLGIALVLLLGAVASPNLSQAQDQLVVTSWGGNLQAVQRKVYMEPFAKETGVKVVEDEWGGELAKLRAMVQSGAPTWDVVEVSDAQLVIGCNEGLLEPLDFSKIGGKDKFMPEAVHECGVGTSVSAGVLAFNADKFPANKQPSTAKDFFDVVNYPGARALRKTPRFNLELAMIADGVAPADIYKVLGTEEGVARAFRKLDVIKPHVKVWFTQWAEAIQLLVSGEVSMTMNGNARVTAAAEQDKKPLKIIWDGQGYGLDYWSVLKGSKKSDLAYRFIAFSSQDRTMNAFIENFRYGPTVKSVIAGMPPNIAAEMPTSPPNMTNAYRIDAGFWSDHNDDYTVRFNAWLSR